MPPCGARLPLSQRNRFCQPPACTAQPAASSAARARGDTVPVIQTSRPIPRGSACTQVVLIVGHFRCPLHRIEGPEHSPASVRQLRRRDAHARQYSLDRVVGVIAQQEQRALQEHFGLVFRLHRHRMTEQLDPAVVWSRRPRTTDSTTTWPSDVFSSVVSAATSRSRVFSASMP